MTFLREANLTAKLSSVDGGAVGGASSAGYGYGQASTHMTGYIESIYVDFPQSGTTQFISITTSTTGKVLLYTLDPSSDGVTYYPRHAANNAADGAAIPSTLPGERIAVKNERMTVIIQSSSNVRYLATEVPIKIIWA